MAIDNKKKLLEKLNKNQSKINESYKKKEIINNLLNIFYKHTFDLLDNKEVEVLFDEDGKITDDTKQKLYIQFITSLNDFISNKLSTDTNIKELQSKDITDRKLSYITKQQQSLTNNLSTNLNVSQLLMLSAICENNKVIDNDESSDIESSDTDDIYTPQISEDTINEVTTFLDEKIENSDMQKINIGITIRWRFWDPNANGGKGGWHYGQSQFSINQDLLKMTSDFLKLILIAVDKFASDHRGWVVTGYDWDVSW